MTFIWHNGIFKPSDTPILTAHDRIRLGDGLFNTVLSIDGKLQHAEMHFEKLLQNTQILWPSWSAPDAESLIITAHELLQNNNHTTNRHALNCTITGGDNGRGLLPADPPAPNIIMRSSAYAPSTAPINALIVQSTRRNEGSPLSQIKYSNYSDHILALNETTAKGANEALLLNNAGNIACTTTANIVIIKNGKFLTPPLSDGCQNGVTRSILMQKYDVKEQSLTEQDLLSSEGAYILNSLKGAIPIHSINGQNLPEPSIKLAPDFHLT